MTIRPSPTVSAQDNPNKIMTGNDGYDYVSRADKNKVFKWHKIVEKKTAKEHYMQFPKYYLNKNFYKFNTNKTTTKLKKN